jgi:quinol monooxygenase YgiN
MMRQSRAGDSCPSDTRRDGRGHKQTADHGAATGVGGDDPCGRMRLTVGLTVTSARSARELLDALRFLMLGTRLEPGCVGCSAWTDPDWMVRYVEEWATEADMRRRVRSDRFTSLLAVVESASEPQVRFDFVTTTRGLDYVAQVRQGRDV